VYKNLKLFPYAVSEGSACIDRGTLAYANNANGNEQLYCDGSYWQTMGGKGTGSYLLSTTGAILKTDHNKCDLVSIFSTYAAAPVRPAEALMSCISACDSYCKAQGYKGATLTQVQDPNVVCGCF